MQDFARQSIDNNRHMITRLAECRICSTVFAIRFFHLPDLEEICVRLEQNQQFSVRYDPHRHPTITVRSKNPKAILIFFRDGHGLAQAISETRVKLAVKRFSRAVGIPEPTIRLVNIVVHGSMGQTLNLDNISVKIPGCVFEPEQFPGAMIKISCGNEIAGFALVFSSGKFSITGLKRYEDIPLCVRQLHELVLNSTPQMTGGLQS